MRECKRERLFAEDALDGGRGGWSGLESGTEALEGED